MGASVMIKPNFGESVEDTLRRENALLRDALRVTCAWVWPDRRASLTEAEKVAARAAVDHAQRLLGMTGSSAVRAWWIGALPTKANHEAEQHEIGDVQAQNDPLDR